MARFRQQKREEQYQIYLTEALRSLNDGIGKYELLRYYDIIKPKKEDKRTAEQVVNHISEKLARMEG